MTQAYIDRYSYEHVPVMGAVDEHANVAFSLHVDKVCRVMCPEQQYRTLLDYPHCSLMLLNLLLQNVRPKEGHYKDQHAAGDVKPSDTIGYVTGAEHKC